jgi:hypothetical protein
MFTRKNFENPSKSVRIDGLQGRNEYGTFAV